jgi:hypothetical protein
MRYKVLLWLGVLLVVFFVAFAFYITYKPWTLVFNAPEYSNFSTFKTAAKSFKDVIAHFVPGITQVKIDFKSRSVLMNVVLPKPKGCASLKGIDYVVTGSTLMESKYYSKDALNNCVQVDAWDNEHERIIATMQNNGIVPVSVRYVEGIYEVKGKRQCGMGTIKVTLQNLDKVKLIMKYWPDCHYTEYRLLYDTGAVLK